MNLEEKKYRVDTINQYRVLQYLKEELDLYYFTLELYDRNTIKVTDRKNKEALFRYNRETKKIDFIEEA